MLVLQTPDLDPFKLVRSACPIDNPVTMPSLLHVSPLRMESNGETVTACTAIKVFLCELCV